MTRRRGHGGAERAAGENLLAIEDLSVYYGNIAAVKGVSLHVRKGEIVTLIGSNGAGKSTTLRTVSGLIRPAQGTLTYQGTSLTSDARAPDRRGRDLPLARRAGGSSRG